MTTKRIAMLLTTILVVGACGSGDDDAVGETSSTTSLPETTTTVGPETTTTTSSTTTTAAPEPEPNDADVLVYLMGGPDADPSTSDCSEVWPVVRTVEAPGVLAGAIEALLAGPTADERATGYDSWFSEEVGWSLASVTISDGVAFIDFAEDSPYINNASTSCGSTSFLAQLDMTATQFPTVDRAIYSIGGDAEAFYGWLQRDVPQV